MQQQIPTAIQDVTKHKKLLTIQEAADQIGAHYQTIRNWIRRNQIEYRRWGNTVRIPLEAVNGKTRQSRGNDL